MWSFLKLLAPSINRTPAVAISKKDAGQPTIRDLAFELDACELFGFPQHVTGDALNYMVWPRWRFRFSKRWTPFAELLCGGTKITHVTTDPEKERILTQKAIEEHRPTPDYSEFHTEGDTNGFSALAKIGLAYRISDAFSWRVGTFGYQRSWTLGHLRGFDYDQGIRFTTGIAVDAWDPGGAKTRL